MDDRIKNALRIIYGFKPSLKDNLTGFADGGSTYDDRAHDFIREQLDTGEPQLKQYDPEAGKETVKEALRIAAGLTTPGAMADVAGYLGGPSALENVRNKNYGTAALQVASAIPGVGPLAKAAKIAEEARAVKEVGTPARFAAKDWVEPKSIFHATSHTFEPSQIRAGSHFGPRDTAVSRAADVIQRGYHREMPVLDILKYKYKPSGDVLNISDEWSGLSPSPHILRGLENKNILSLKDYENMAKKGILTPKELDDLIYGTKIEQQAPADKILPGILKKKGISTIEYENAIENPGSKSWIVYDPESLKFVDQGKFSFDPDLEPIGSALDEAFARKNGGEIGRAKYLEGGTATNDDLIERKEWSPFRGLKIRPPAEKLSTEPDIRDYQLKRHAYEFEGGEEPTAPHRKITLDAPAFGGKKELGDVPYYYADPINTALNLAYGLKTAPLYSNPYTAPVGRAIDAYETAKKIEEKPDDITSFAGAPKVLRGAGPLGLLGIGAGILATDTDTDEDKQREDKGRADGGIIERALRIARDKGGKARSAEALAKEILRKQKPAPGSAEYWAERDKTYAQPYSERLKNPEDPMRYISPEEYRKGNLGYKEYALANGGRAGYALGGEPTDLPTDNPVLDQPDPTRSFVQSLYQNIMGRQGEQGGLDYWSDQLNQGNVSQADVLQQFAKSNEFQDLYKQDPSKAVSALYQTALGRAPEQGGLDYWTGQAKQGLDLGQMVSSFTGSSEGQDVQDINRLYQAYSGNVATPQQIQQAQGLLGKEGDWMNFLGKTFPNQFDQQGTQVAGDFITDAINSGVGAVTGAVEDAVAASKKYFIQAMDEMGITDPEVRTAMAANVQGETNFEPKPELSYAHTSNSRIRQLFSNTRKLSDAQLNELKSDDRAFFNKIYGNKLGNKGGDDGYNYRGRGAVQLTGRDNYAKYGDLAGLGDQLVKNPDLMNDPRVAAKVSVAYMNDMNKNRRGKDPFTRITLGVNPYPETVAKKQVAYRQMGKDNPFSVYTEPAVATDTSQAGKFDPAVATSQINAIYDKYLHQPPSQQGLDNLLNQLGSGKVNMQDIDNFIKNSNEAKTASSYQNYRKQFDEWKAAIAARKKFEAEYVGNEIRNGRNPFSPPANVGPQVPPMPEWDNSKVPEMTQKYQSYVPLVGGQSSTAGAEGQSNTSTGTGGQQPDLFTQAWQKYQSDYNNWKAQADAHRLIAAMTGSDPNLPWHLQVSMPQPPNRADYPAGGPATGIKPIGETLAGQGAGGPTGTPGNTGVITPGGQGTSIGTDKGASNINWTPEQTGQLPSGSGQIPYNAGAIFDPWTGQTTNQAWDPNTGIGIYSPAYQGPGKYDLGLSNTPVSPWGVTTLKNGGAVKDALDLAKRKMSK